MPKFPEAELEVLACLWQKGEATAREVREQLKPFRPLTHSAVCTLLSRLQSKGFVDRRKGTVGKAFLYRATRRPKPARSRLVANLVERIFGGDALAVVSSLFETKAPTAAELDALQRLVDELRSHSPRAKSGRPRTSKTKGGVS